MRVWPLLGCGAVAPQGDLLDGDVHRAVGVVDDASFGDAADVELAELGCGDLAVAVVVGEPELAEDRTFALQRRDVDRAARAVVHAQAFGVAGADHTAFVDLLQLTGRRVDGVRLEPRAVRDGDQVTVEAADRDVRPDVGVAPERRAVSDPLNQVAVQVVALERTLLVVAEDQRLARVGLVDPDRGLVGGVAGVGDGRCLVIGLDQGGDFRSGVAGETGGGHEHEARHDRQAQDSADPYGETAAVHAAVCVNSNGRSTVSGRLGGLSGDQGPRHGDDVTACHPELSVRGRVDGPMRY